MWKFATVGVCALALFVSTGMGVYAYESPDVSVGHPLFGLKRGIEQVEGQFARTPEDRARFHQRMMNRRMEEAERHLARPARAVRILEMAADELDMSLQEFTGNLRDPAVREQMLDELAAENERYAEVIERVGEHVREFRREKPEEFRELIQRFRVQPPPSDEPLIQY